MRYGKLRGGITNSNQGVSKQALIWFLFILLLVNFILIGLIWGNVVKFVSTDAKLIVGITLTIVTGAISIYLSYLYLPTVSFSLCNCKNTCAFATSASSLPTYLTT